MTALQNLQVNTNRLSCAIASATVRGGRGLEPKTGNYVVRRLIKGKLPQFALSLRQFRGE